MAEVLLAVSLTRLSTHLHLMAIITRSIDELRFQEAELWRVDTMLLEGCRQVVFYSNLKWCSFNLIPTFFCSKKKPFKIGN